MADFKDLVIIKLKELGSDKSWIEILRVFKGVPVWILNERIGGQWTEERKKEIIDLFKEGKIAMFGGAMYKTLPRKVQTYLNTEVLERDNHILGYPVSSPPENKV